jgi:hypothetical protein
VSIYAPITVPATPAANPATPTAKAILSDSLTGSFYPVAVALDSSGNVYVGLRGWQSITGVAIFAANDIKDAINAGSGSPITVSIAPSTFLASTQSGASALQLVGRIALDVAGNLYVGKQMRAIAQDHVTETHRLEVRKPSAHDLVAGR